MIKMLELREMINLVSKSSIQEFSIKNNGVKIMMKKAFPKVSESSEETIQTAATLEAAPQSSAQVDPTREDMSKEAALHQMVSPVIGVFSSSTGPGAEPYVRVGKKITKGKIIGSCKVERLDLNHEIPSDVDGEIVEVLVENGEVVEYGKPL